MPRVDPNPRAVQALGSSAGRRVRFTFTGIKGLVLDCIPDGTKHGNRIWRARYYLGERERTDTLGSFNERAEDFISLAKATELCAERRRLAKVERKDPRAEALTFDALLARWVEAYARPQLRSWERYKQLYETRAQRHVGRVRIADLKKRDLIEVRDSIAKASTGGQADKCIRIISSVLSWGEREALVETNVARGIQALAPIQARDRTLTDDELRRTWDALDDTPKCDVIRLLLLTGQRLSDVAGMSTTELIDGGWEIPRDRHKSKGAHFVPLTSKASEIIDRRKGASEFVFPAIPRGRGIPLDKPMSRFTPDHALAGIFASLGIADAAVHDLRRTMATNLGRMSVPREIIDRVQGRDARGRGSGWIYNRHDYADDKRRALELWERRLLAIVEGGPPPTERW